ncbi:hypothetical protein CWE09_13010 [Aliidiomarina minuta]|uniref:HDOD domain-containing protein n=1 Tax=Aliidiomarina minuta TaxID=880057 RepID=A0A432W3Y7_9GAMM|nr:HDOD domain-containing protein [Aliidiomarina minuta]RUO24057.1 hypothetical protein CWE09_13010 [Aliidiomarina minuta]
MSQYKQFRVSTQNGTDDRLSLLNRRFINYLISLNFARGQYMAEEGLEEDEDYETRELLAVEQHQRAEKARKNAVQDRQREEVEKLLHARVYKEIEKRLQDHEYICERVLGIPASTPKLLDAIHAPSTTSRQVEQLATNLDWLQIGLVKIVNMPPFADPNDSKRAKITNFRGALNFVGAVDLCVIVPALAMQSWLPPAEPPFSLLRRKLWQHVLGTGILTQRLAELDGKLDPAVAFAAGIFHEMGKVVLARLFLLVFDDVRSRMFDTFRKDPHSRRYNALLEIKPDQQFLRDLMLQKEREVTGNLFKGFAFQRLPLDAIYEEFAAARSIKDTTGYARILTQANTYSEFRLLHAANLATLEDGKKMFANVRLSGKTILELRKLHLKKLILSRGRES